jgi:hypothetical protein
VERVGVRGAKRDGGERDLEYVLERSRSAEFIIHLVEQK